MRKGENLHLYSRAPVSTLVSSKMYELYKIGAKLFGQEDLPVTRLSCRIRAFSIYIVVDINLRRRDKGGMLTLY
ncbi:unnamed protein product [Camellia sinensis]